MMLKKDALVWEVFTKLKLKFEVGEDLAFQKLPVSFNQHGHLLLRPQLIRKPMQICTT